MARRKQEEEAQGVSRSPKRARHSSSSPPDPAPHFNDDTPAIADTVDMETLPEPESPPASFSFSGRRRKVPRVLKNYLPHSLVGLPSHLHPAPPKPSTPAAELDVPSPASTPDPEPELEADTMFTTEPNGFGLYRQYARMPRSDPEDVLTLEDLVDETMPDQNHSESATVTEAPYPVLADSYHPFPNATVFRYINWYLGVSRTLSVVDLDRLASEVILSDDFNREDFRTFSAARELRRLDQYGSTDIPFAADDGWKVGSVMLHVPNSKCKHPSESASPQFRVSGIYYRPLLEVIKAACQGSQAKKYHWVPFKLVHQSPAGHMRTYTDIYNSNAMLEEDARIRALGRHAGDDPDTEVAMLAILLWSDSTHLTSFGTASLWPVYMYLGNLSKYVRGRPNAHAAHHLAYIPSVSFESDLRFQDSLPLISSPTLSRISI